MIIMIIMIIIIIIIIIIAQFLKCDTVATLQAQHQVTNAEILLQGVVKSNVDMYRKPNIT